MIEGLRGYLLSIVAAALLLSLAQLLIPNAKLGRTAKLISSLVLILVILAPLREVSFQSIAQEISKLWLEADAAETGIPVTGREAIGSIIKEKTEAYILDKAEALGCQVNVEVTVNTDAGYPYPSAVHITGRWSEGARRTLQKDIEANLAIPEDAQQWSGN